MDSDGKGCIGIFLGTIIVGIIGSLISRYWPPIIGVLSLIPCLVFLWFVVSYIREKIKEKDYNSLWDGISCVGYFVGWIAPPILLLEFISNKDVAMTLAVVWLVEYVFILDYVQMKIDRRK